ncbi:two-component system sensor histidine kinase YesM [Aequitasia blattaphilus]|uniref:histidine kinase n=1 Tax=Aequitasia blattaphilus TaxID=2949332 RepID=A0ABT1E6M9_9FIRM|nr:sensor histidine kinase [Aequitasia blattaphilus]MCP1101418.1 sensor histidine kinase [Aequitasia blattaphilus]MCR8614058.1 sensor histidine kinase [Aequitasia blattaphilus]
MKSIRSKILGSILFITILTSLVITIIFYRKSADTIEENYISSNQERNRQLIENLDQNMQGIYHVLVATSCDEELKVLIEEFSQNKEDAVLEQISTILKTYNKQNTAISSFHLILPEEQVLVTSEAYPIYKKVVEKKSIEGMLEETTDKAGPFLLNNLISGKSPHLGFVETIVDNGKITGYICANIEERYLYYNYISELKNDTVNEVFLLDRENKVISTVDGGVINERATINIENIDQDDQNINFYSKAPFSGCALYISVSREAVLGDLSQIRIYYGGIFFLCLVLAIILAAYVARRIYEPVETLAITVKDVSEGNLEQRAKVTTKDEIGTLSVEFNQMLDHIEELIGQVIEKENLKKDAELEALQYQVTPHFMYNTLNSIKYAARIRGEHELADLIASFVELLQASISKKGAFLTVSEEIYILKNYVRLQEFRSNSEIQMICDIAPEVQDCLLPRLILQPLVENSLLHGIDLKENSGKIVIKAEKREDSLYIEVTDNGRGISEEKIEEIMNQKAKKTKGFTAIGVPNIKERLKLYYGEKAGMQYIRNPKGTTVVIYLPPQKESGEVI